ncbi:uncharacterized protein LOC132705278 isoform X2 [Cylas formicarius]|uniref:uncharacterized protein LOC132705278 isoform X2 n=1 Tax=Cylas formicarius TaxID=197179 RepID=UPI002958972A|nr:uncharacterized protein LOC132705278 isoform X2 [Cylas formicarius]
MVLSSIIARVHLVTAIAITAAFPNGHSAIQDPILSPLSGIGDSVNSKIAQAINPQMFNLVTPFPDSGRKWAVQESSAKESFPIQYDIKYGNLQNFVANLVNPRPIVDTIQEHEKYGNEGDKSRQLGIFVVGAFEGFSNAINAVVDAPFEIARQAGKKLTNSLNQVGGKLVGLA